MKHDVHGQAAQETQLIGMEEFSKATLEGKVDLNKVKEIRRAIRRRYANRKNFQKIFSLWDEEGKGKISVENAFEMINKMGLNVNRNEARVLIASADKDFSGDLSLEEFMDLIHNVNDTLNVNLKSLTEMEGANMEKYEEQLQKDALLTKEKQHQNKLNLVLKNKQQYLGNYFKEADPLKQGQINFEQFQTIIKKYRCAYSSLQAADHRQGPVQRRRQEHLRPLQEGRTPLQLPRVHEAHPRLPAQQRRPLRTSIPSYPPRKTSNRRRRRRPSTTSTS